MKKLKRCPCCDGQAILLDGNKYMEDCFINKTTIICQKCGLSLEGTNELNLIRKWNTRKPIDNLIAALKNHPNLFTELGWENFYISINDVIETIKERM